MILMNDFKAEPEEDRQAALRAVERVLRSGWYILGNEVKQFESAWASACGAHHAIGVANGMDAIEIGIRALGIGPGDEVITTTMSAFATVLAIIRAGATPVLADIDPATALLSKASVESCITKRTRAVLLVHLYGQVRDMDEWIKLCADHKLLLLEDCAQSHLAHSQGRITGTFGEWGAYSFYPTKNLGALGDAGALVTNREDIASEARMLLNYGQSKRYHHPKLGLNSRLDEMQAAILLARLVSLSLNTLRRQQIARMYFEQIDNPEIEMLAKPLEEGNHVYHLFVVLCRQRDKLAAHMRSQNVETLIHYPIPIHKQPPCSEVIVSPQGLAQAEKHADMCLSLPCNPHLTDSQVRHIIGAANA
ncbi:MAG: DegT/DnrJ/EryC1/StrS family aminotransferase, partial [Actinomycetes bacterium]